MATMSNSALSNFDFESYINNYQGHTRIHRALYIANHCENLKIPAYEWAIKEIKNITKDTELYINTVKKLNDILIYEQRPSIELDQAWITATQQENSVTLESIQSELKHSKNTLNKENIRICHKKLGDYYYQTGDLNEALRNYARMREYCATGLQTVNMCFDVMMVNIEQKGHNHVQSYATRAETTPNIPRKEIVKSKVDCYLAVSALASGEPFEIVANYLMKTSFEKDAQCNTILSPNDVAVYGGLCALASFDREKLHQILTSASFKQFLELEPHVGDIMESFYRSDYASCFQLLDQYKDVFALDMYLGPRLDNLLSMVSERAMIQYCLPYSTVDLRRMASAFNMEVHALQKKLATLIGDNGRIQARIDSEHKVLYAKQYDQRRSTFKRTLETGADYESSAKKLLLRFKLLKADMVVK